MVMEEQPREVTHVGQVEEEGGRSMLVTAYNEVVFLSMPTPGPHYYKPETARELAEILNHAADHAEGKEHTHNGE